MPLYEYHCSKCDEVFQVKQRITEDPLTTHPDCGGAVERLISATSFVLKGGGWYKTDYAAGGKSAPASSGGESAGGGESGSDGGGATSASGGGHACGGGGCGCAA